MPQCGDAKFFQVLSREVREDPLVVSRNATSYSSRPRLRSQTTMCMTAPTQRCCTSSVGLGRVSRMSEIGDFSANRCAPYPSANHRVGPTVSIKAPGHLRGPATVRSPGVPEKAQPVVDHTLPNVPRKQSGRRRENVAARRPR
jgi:hypothetical protein